MAHWLESSAQHRGHGNGTNGESRGRPETLDAQIVTDARGTRLSEPESEQPKTPRKHWARRIVIALILLAILGAGAWIAAPHIRTAWTTVSTDDAFVAGHITEVSPRIDDVVTEVFVDQDDRVEPGQLLVRLDRQPFDVAVAKAEASLDEAKADLIDARARVKSQIAEARGNWYRRKNAQERLRQQVATLHAQFAALRARESSRWLAEVEQRRIANLVKRGSATQSELDQRDNELKVAIEREKEARAAIQETRAAIGLEPNEKDPLDVPKDLETQQSTVQSAVSDVASSLARVGIPFDPKDAAQARAFQDFLRPEGGKSAGEGLESVVEQAPAVQVARAAVDRARRELDDARLRWSWTEIRAEVAGFVQDRHVNPGNRVEPGQTLLTVRPDYVWVDANYKETQIQHIRIGQPVDIYVDAYPHRVFRGRVAGFSPGTGLSQSLLPPENATGNYVKVTQRLPVRIELTGPNPADTPLFAGLSVVPYVQLEGRPTGPGAGERLHRFGTVRGPDLGAGPAGARPENRGTKGQAAP
ncbi:MAG TPA: HlyD family secretion protein [Isosphaeraceae bacterium]|jgi:membrane fusion protein (multidrug efflux system)|nr:HlyD family secretion protein [Isosphaeraceae bacterium]